MSLSSLRWPLLALLGLLVAAAIAFLATRAVSEEIGISSEPPTAGRALSPAAPRKAEPKPRTTTSTTTTTPAPHRTTTVTVPAPPDGGEGGEGGDD